MRWITCLTPGSACRPTEGRPPSLPVLMALGAGMVASAAAFAGERKFTYTYEATTQPPGTVEYEQWVTWKTRKASDTDFDRLEFRHEFEFGITDRFQLAIYLADWRYQDGRSVDNNRVEYRNSAVELIYNLSDPTLDPIGSALYGEVKIGDAVFALEGKMILQKNMGQWTGAYNATIEAEWEGRDFDEDKGEFEQTVGLSYQVSPNLTLGGELLHEIEFPNWSDSGDHVLYVGPNASLRTDAWWFTVTPLFQVTDVDSEVDFQVRFIFGFDF